MKLEMPVGAGDGNTDAVRAAPLGSLGGGEPWQDAEGDEGLLVQGQPELPLNGGTAVNLQMHTEWGRRTFWPCQESVPSH